MDAKELPSGAQIQDMPKLRVFIPVVDNGMGYVTANYCVSFFAAINDWAIREMQNGRIIEVDIRRVSGSHADRAMNTMTADFLASDNDELLIVDTDIIVTGEQLFHLFEHDLPLVYGPYAKKQVKEENCLCVLGGQEFAIGGNSPHPSLLEVRRAGRGFLRAKRWLFGVIADQMADCFHEFTNHGRAEVNYWQSGVVKGGYSAMSEGEGEWISEDWMLCEFARACGIPIYVDTRILGIHEGMTLFPLQVNKEALGTILARQTADDVMEALRADERLEEACSDTFDLRV